MATIRLHFHIIRTLGLVAFLSSLYASFLLLGLFVSLYLQEFVSNLTKSIIVISCCMMYGLNAKYPYCRRWGMRRYVSSSSFEKLG